MQFSRLISPCIIFGLVLQTHAIGLCEEVKEIERRTEKGKKDNDSFFIVFIARGPSLKDKSLSGHAFVSLGKDDATAQSCSARSFGVYPKQGIGWFGPVPAKMVPELWKFSDFRLIVKVDRDVFEKVDSFRGSYIAKHVEGKFELGSRDCVTFASECAKLVGLKIPERKDALFPSTFVEELLKMN